MTDLFGQIQSNGKGMGGHQSSKMLKCEWLTPPDIIEALGAFDLDPCSPVTRPWATAKKHYHVHDNGLVQEWQGRVWLNPPYGKHAVAWMRKMAHHQDGTALLYARLDTNMFHDEIFPHALSMLFIRHRLRFYHVTGKRGADNGGAPSVLIAYTEYDAEQLEQSGIDGMHMSCQPLCFVTMREGGTWRSIVSSALYRLDRRAHLKDIYNAVRHIAPAKIEGLQFWQEKVRQVLQMHFKGKGSGVWAVS